MLLFWPALITWYRVTELSVTAEKREVFVNLKSWYFCFNTVTLAKNSYSHLSTNMSISESLQSYQIIAQQMALTQGSPTFLKLRATSCVPINAKGC